jgi:hypothetical protein
LGQIPAEDFARVTQAGTFLQCLSLDTRSDPVFPCRH